MVMPEVIVLADEVQAHLERGDLAGLGPVDFGPDGTWPDAEHAARIVLADVAHRLEPGRAFDREVPGASWEDLARQLGRLEAAIHRRLGERDGTPAEPAEPTKPQDEGALFRLALQGSPVIVYRQDAELRHTWISNPQHGFAPEAVLGKTDAELVEPEDAAILAVIKRRVLATGIGERQEVRVTVGDEAAYYDLTIEPLRGPAGEIVGITGAATNITPLKRTQQALAQREAQLAEAQRLAQLGSWELDLVAGRYSWSDEHYRIFGVDRQVGPLTPEVVRGPIHPEDLPRTRAIFKTSLRTGEPYETEFRVVRSDGEVRLIHSRGALLRDASGRPERMVGTAQDVTERRRAEEERTIQRERQARLAGMLFAARELAARLGENPAESCGAADAPQPESALVPQLQAAIDAAAEELSRLLRDIAEPQQLSLSPPAEGDRPETAT